MKHQGTKTIETSRLILRAFKLSDVEFAYKNWTSDSQVTEFLSWPVHSDTSITEMVIKDWIENSKKKDYYQWAIVLKEINEPIGSISVVEKNDDLELVQIGYCIGSSWWNQGITTEAFKGVISYFFNEVKVNRIEAIHDPENLASGEVMKKCGLQYEGTLRQASKSNKGIVDACMYSLLREEYTHE